MAPEGISSMEASPRREKAEIEDGKGQREGEESGGGSSGPERSKQDPTMFDTDLFEVLPLPPINPTKEPRAVTSSFPNQDKCSEPERVEVQQGGESGRRQEDSSVQKKAESIEVREQSVAAIIHQAMEKAVVI